MVDCWMERVRQLAKLHRKKLKQSKEKIATQPVVLADLLKRQPCDPSPSKIHLMKALLRKRSVMQRANTGPEAVTELNRAGNLCPVNKYEMGNFDLVAEPFTIRERSNFDNEQEHICDSEYWQHSIG
jgi:hypothetical protein